MWHYQSSYAAVKVPAYLLALGEKNSCKNNNKTHQKLTIVPALVPRLLLDLWSVHDLTLGVDVGKQVIWNPCLGKHFTLQRWVFSTRVCDRILGTWLESFTPHSHFSLRYRLLSSSYRGGHLVAFRHDGGGALVGWHHVGAGLSFFLHCSGNLCGPSDNITQLKWKISTHLTQDRMQHTFRHRILFQSFSCSFSIVWSWKPLGVVEDFRVSIKMINTKTSDIERNSLSEFSFQVADPL